MSELYVKFGELLKLERERQGVGLADVSTELKIAESALLSIEAGDASELPSELYFKMFSKSYAEYLGIDFARTIEAIREELGEDLEQDTRSEGTSRQRRRSGDGSEIKTNDRKAATATRGNVRRLVVLVSIIVGAFVVFLVVSQLFFSGDNGQDRPGLSLGSAADTSEGTGGEEDRSEDLAYNWNVPAYEPPDSIELSLLAREESWVSILADGDTALRQTIHPGRQYALKAKYRFDVLSIGVPRMVDVRIDGVPAYLANPETGRILGVEIDQTNRGLFGSRPAPAVPDVIEATYVGTPDSTQERSSENF